MGIFFNEDASENDEEPLEIPGTSLFSRLQGESVTPECQNDSRIVLNEDEEM